MATVYLIGKEISDDRTVRIHCHLDQEDESLLPGMYLTAQIESAVKKSPSLPDNAIINFEGGHYLFLVKDVNKRNYEMIKVVTGETQSGFTEVILPEEINPNSQFIIKGTYELLSLLKNNEEE